MRSWSCAVLLVLAVVACAPSARLSRYTPRWRVGDWWTVKTWAPATSGLADDSGWSYKRYDIAGVEKVGNQDCYVLRAGRQGRGGGPSKSDFVWYVRTDNWLVVRQVLFSRSFSSVTPDTEDYPLGLIGPLFGGEPGLPRFPLKPESLDTVFKPRKLDDYSAWLREMTSIADPASVRRLLDEGDTTGGRVVRPTRRVFQVQTEAGGNLRLGPQPPERRIVQNLQLWSEGQPWRIYGELAQYDARNPTWRVVERNWLTARGHESK
jgi:hypothetical protein